MKNGSRLRAMVDVDTTALVFYHAPFTDGFRCVIPAGTELVVYGETDEGSHQFHCRLAEPLAEARLVPPEIRDGAKYAGCAFQFSMREIGRRLELVSEGGAAERSGQ